MKERKRKGALGRALKWILLCMALLAAGFVLFACAALYDLDAWESFDPEKILGADQTTILYDADNRETVRLHGAEDRVSIEIETLPAHVRYAFVSAEDARFYEHEGVDVIRIFGAAWEDIKAGGYVQGASTISQQLIKLSHLTSEKTISRKLEEAVLAYRMEHVYSKDEVLEMYLNYVYFGRGYYGIEAASLGYFGKHAEELSIAEAAMLAGVLKAPSHYAPHLDMQASLKRRNTILGLMCQYGHISAEQRDAARAEQPHILAQSGSASRGYYVDTALREAEAALHIDAETLLTGGYRIYTAMDSELQAHCERLFADDALFPGEGVQGALVVQRTNSPFLAALIGGRGESAARSFNRAVDIRRQPGSVIKPILCYAPALESGGYTAATPLLDEPTAFADYAPRNYASRYYGWVTLRQAVAKSLNVPAVKVLSDIGVANGKAFAEDVGIEFDETDNSLALALGGFTYGVSPLMVAGAYNCFASGGVYYAPRTVRAITDAQGTVLYDADTAGRRAMCEENAYILTSMLQSVVAEGTGRRLGELNIELAGKTGTVGESGGNRDAWMAAYEPAYTAAVWIGYDSAQQGTLPDEATGGRYPAMLLSALFEHIYAEREAPRFAPPSGIVNVRLDAYSLKTRHELTLATALTPSASVLSEVFMEGTQPTASSDYWAVPLSAGAFRAEVKGGYPIVEFVAREPHVVYKLYREAEGSGAQCIKEWSGAQGALAYTDNGAHPGLRYTYYIVPEHPSMRVGGKRVSGPATARLKVEMPVLQLVPGGASDGRLSFGGGATEPGE